MQRSETAGESLNRKSNNGVEKKTLKCLRPYVTNTFLKIIRNFELNLPSCRIIVKLCVKQNIMNAPIFFFYLIYLIYICFNTCTY